MPIPRRERERKKVELIEDEEWDRFRPVCQERFGSTPVRSGEILKFAKFKGYLLFTRGLGSPRSQEVFFRNSLRRQVSRGMECFYETKTPTYRVRRYVYGAERP